MSIARAVITALRERGLTIGVAESLTGGDLVSSLVSVPGASNALLGGVVAYATPLKHSLLGVDAALLAEHGAVHPEVARQMAEGVRSAVAVDEKPADVGVSTTGVAGPDPQDGQPVGRVHIAVATDAGCRIRSFLFEGDRSEIRTQATDAALSAILEALSETTSSRE